MTIRYLPSREFPTYKFTPGRNTHPHKKGGHSYNLNDPIVSKIDLQNLKNNNDFLYSLDLFNYEYYWESHVYLEAIWNEHKRTGNEADLCKGLIKIAAGFLKKRLNQEEVSKELVNKGHEIVKDLIGQFKLPIKIDITNGKVVLID